MNLQLSELLFGTAVIYSVIAYYLTRSSFIADVQSENADIAANLSHEITQTVSGEIDGQLVEQLFQAMSIVNPDVQLYLLGPEGDVFSSSVEGLPLLQKNVSLPSLQAFFRDDRKFPLFAEDPLSNDALVTFSVAEIKRGDRLMGYLYITLNAQSSDDSTSPRKLISHRTMRSQGSVKPTTRWPS